MAAQTRRFRHKPTHKRRPLPHLKQEAISSKKESDYKYRTRHPRKPFSIPPKGCKSRQRHKFSSIRARREKLAETARETLVALSLATLQSSGGPFSTDLFRSRQETSFYPHQSPLLANWPTGQPLSSQSCSSSGTDFIFKASSTLSLAHAFASYFDEHAIGLLNATSPKKPGGACLSGGSAQDECLARQTTIFDSLQNSVAGSSYYAEHRNASDGSGFHDHSMLYSPHVAVLKDEDGRELTPFFVDVLSCVPVNASTVRSKFHINPQDLESGIRHVMEERMGRILRLFEERGVKTLVLGAFGVGQFCNSPIMIGEIWADLLMVRGARFRNSFDKVLFALPGKHCAAFENAFNSRSLESDFLQAMNSN